MKEEFLKINNNLILSQNEGDRAVVLDPINIKLCELNNQGLAILSLCNGSLSSILDLLEKKGISKTMALKFIFELKNFGLVENAKSPLKVTTELLTNLEATELLKNKQNEQPFLKQCDLSSGYFSKYLPK